MKEAGMIPKEAVTAAIAAVRSEMESRTYDRHAYDDEVFSEGVIDIAAAALEAAAPYLRAQALEDAADDFEGNIGIAEFDELSSHDGSRWAHVEEAWEHQGPYMDWLRARAVTERGEG